MTRPGLDADLAAARGRLASARSLLVLTGAGISVASGLPTYRGATSSLYQDPAMLRLASGSALRADPAGTWRAFAALRAGSRAVRPGPGHEAVARLARAVEGRAEGGRALVCTQNVDGLHRGAGSAGVVELHGSLGRARCLDDACPAAPWELVEPAPLDVPACPWCGGPARPDVVLFGEGDDAPWAPVRDHLARPVDVVLLVGTSGVVPVPAELIRLARAAGPTWVLDVNPSPSIDGVDAALRGAAEDVLPSLADGP